MKIIRCSCYEEAVAVESDPDDELIELAFWQQGHHRHRGLAFRIRQIMKIIWDGVPYTDMVMLSPDEAKTLATSLFNAAKSAKLKTAERSHGTRGHVEVHDPVSRECAS
jgi:hypothetical protein